jgi:sigma-B regulation protein RsbU (phosphoserine phosphatase)
VTAQHVVGMFRSGAAPTAIGVALITIALTLLAFALVGRVFANAGLFAAAAFAALYGVRLIVNVPAFRLFIPEDAWLAYVSSALEYIVPIPAALLVRYAFGKRWKRLNQLVVIVVIALAAIAIPYEIAVHRPFALKPLIDGFVVLLMPIFLVNLFTQSDEDDDRRIVRWGSAIFVLFVLNEHFGLRGAEPFGFLIFIGSFILMLMRRAVRGQVRLGAVESELATARTIQMSIIPRTPPRVNGLEIASVYSPATEVAGDFFDFIRVDDERLGVLVADVSGHGVPAALVASMLKIALATQSAHAAAPATLLANLHALFRGKLERQHITAAYAFIDTTNGALRVASAGHPPPLIRRANGSVEELETPGTVLGRFANFEAADVEATLAPGDALLLYTDGVTEAMKSVTRQPSSVIRGDEEMWGDERLRAAFAATSDVNAIADAVSAWSGGRVGDDVTLVVLRVPSA